jgi:hypothetical protein
MKRAALSSEISLDPHWLITIESSVNLVAPTVKVLSDSSLSSRLLAALLQVIFR